MKEVKGGGAEREIKREKSVSAGEVDRKGEAAAEREGQSVRQSAEQTVESPLLSVTAPPPTPPPPPTRRTK